MTNLSDSALVSSYDDLPLWSAPFGLHLLEAVPVRHGLDVLDIGCGTGFPLLELAGRLGATCRLIGIDPWEAALERIRVKIRTWGLKNVTVVAGTAEAMPFPDRSFDLIVSNNGINNVSDQDAALHECARVSRPGARLVITMNLPDTMQEFYDTYRDVLRSRKLGRLLPALEEHIHGKRKPAGWICGLVEHAGFRMERREERVFTMRFADGAALFGHPFIRLAFLEPWKSVVPPKEVNAVFRDLEEELDRRASVAGELRLTVPFLCLSAVRT